MLRKTLLFTLLIILLTACVPATPPTPSEAGTFLTNRPLGGEPPFFTAFLADYLPVGYKATDGDWTVKLDGFNATKSAVDFTLCFKSADNCIPQHVQLDENGVGTTFLSPNERYIFIVYKTDTNGDPNVEIWHTHDVEIPMVKDEPAPVAANSTVAPTLNPATNTLLATVIGLKLEELQQGYWHQICANGCVKGRFFKNPDRFELLGGGTLLYDPAAVILPMLNESKRTEQNPYGILEGEKYYVCAMPGNQVYVNGVLWLEGECKIGIYEGIREGYVDQIQEDGKVKNVKAGWYQFIAPHGEIMRLHSFAGAFNVYQTLK